MIICPVTVFGPTLPNVMQRDINVTDRYWPLPNFTVTCVTRVTSVTDLNIGPFQQILKQVTVRFGNGR